MKPASSLCRLPFLPSSSIIPNPVKELSSYMISGVLQAQDCHFRGVNVSESPCSFRLPTDPCFLLWGKKNLRAQFRPANIGYLNSGNSSGRGLWWQRIYRNSHFVGLKVTSGLGSRSDSDTDADTEERLVRCFVGVNIRALKDPAPCQQGFRPLDYRTLEFPMRMIEEESTV